MQAFIGYSLHRIALHANGVFSSELRRDRVPRLVRRALARDDRLLRLDFDRHCAALRLLHYCEYYLSSVSVCHRKIFAKIFSSKSDCRILNKTTMFVVCVLYSTYTQIVRKGSPEKICRLMKWRRIFEHLLPKFNIASQNQSVGILFPRNPSLNKTNWCTYLSQGTSCDLSKFIISINLILIVIMSGISITPAIQEHQPRSGLLQSSVVSLYIVYLTWSALANSAGDCNPTHTPNAKVSFLICSFSLA